MTAPSIDVPTQYTLMGAKADQVLGLAEGFLAQLLETTNVFFSDGFNIDALLPDAYNYASVPLVAFPIVGTGIRPNVANLDASGVVPAVPSFDFTALVPIVLPADDLVTPTNTFAYAEGAYDRALLDPWRAKLLADLQNGGYGIDTNDEIALLNRTRDREVEVMLTRFDEASRLMAARGFPLPPGELAIQIDRAAQDMQSKVSDTNREIYIDRAKRYVENRRFTITEIREMEQVLIAFYNAVQERALNVAKVSLEFAVQIFNTQVARYKARLDAAIAAGQVQFQRAQAEAERARAVTAIFAAQVSAYEVSLRRAVDVARVQVEAYGVDVQLDKVINDGLIARAGLQQKVIESTVQQNIQIDTVAIETAKAKLLATVEALKFRAEASQFSSEKFFSLLTSLVSSITALAVQSQSA